MQKPHVFSLFLVLLYLALSAHQGQARPEYALKTKQSCVSCHAIPMGGGPRTLLGKSYGSHDHAPALTSQSDVYYADLRLQAYYPTSRTTEQSNGVALMVAAPAANVPIVKSENGSSLHALLSADFGILSTGTREAVLIWKTSDAASALVPDYAMLGRFYPAFGLMTDEHRTYTRIQSPTSLRDYELGGELTWFLPAGLQLNLALTNGFQSGGTFTSSDVTLAGTFDLRWNPPNLPLLLGTSAAAHGTTTRTPSPYAASLYSGFSVGRLTEGVLPLTLLGEFAIAKNWNRTEFNPRLDFFFAGETAYPLLVADATSIGIYGELLYDLSPQFSLTYKYDRLQFNASYGGDAYSRHGFGFRWHLASNISLLVRYELAGVGRPDAQSSLARAAQDDLLGMLRFWL